VVTFTFFLTKQSNLTSKHTKHAHYWNKRAISHLKKNQVAFFSTMNFFSSFSIFTAHLRKEDLKILKSSKTKVLLSKSYATIMNFSKNENHSTPLYVKFKRFNTVQLQEITVADPLESPILNFYSTLFGLLGCYNKKIGFLNLDLQLFLARTMKID
jgi:hypothetical protein